MKKRPSTADVILLALAGWYVQHVVRWERGPGDVFEKSRTYVHGPSLRKRSLTLQRFLESLLECIFCAGPYVGVAVLVLWIVCPLLIVPFAVAGAIVMLDKYVRQ